MLRPFEPSDADAYFEWMRDPEAVRQAAFTASDPDDRAAFDAWLARNLGNPEVINRIIEVDGTAVGSISSFTIEGDRELSYWIDPALWGRGYASAAVEEFLAIEPIRPLFARTASHNVGSARVLERNGFLEVGRDVGYANGVGAEIEEIIHRLD
ncbi:MAG: GNAT family N-acetyltransferase [Pseudolysinimonas sp.]|uniref:GNAT family N-acetyltransferase n=1 Tax=Pseudolysinimonas sp. TaxID=2680009 RepID=UPI003267D810